jgi:hypothetical protein
MIALQQCMQQLNPAMGPNKKDLPARGHTRRPPTKQPHHVRMRAHVEPIRSCIILYLKKEKKTNKHDNRKRKKNKHRSTKFETKKNKDLSKEEWK